MEHNLQSHAPEQNNNHEQSSLLSKTKIALTTLLISMGAFSYGQNTTIQGKTDIKMEQLTTTDDPKAKADVSNLMKKYNVATLDDIANLPLKGIESMLIDVFKLMRQDPRMDYFKDTTMVHLRQQLRDDLELGSENFNEIEWKKTLDGLYELAKAKEELAKEKDELAKEKDELAKAKDELAKAKKENEEVRQVAQQYGINK